MKFIVKAVIIGFLISLVFIIWIVFSNVLYNPSGGLVTELDEVAQKDMSGEYLDNWNEHHDTDANTFGFLGVLIMGMLFICLVIYAFDKRRRSDES